MKIILAKKKENNVIRLLEDAFLMFHVPSQDYRPVDRIFQRKMHCLDLTIHSSLMTLIKHLVNYRPINPESDPPDSGHRQRVLRGEPGIRPRRPQH